MKYTVLHQDASWYFKNKNWLTPDIEGYFKTGKLVVELASGEFMGEILYGATFKDTDTNQTDYDQSSSFNDKEEALQYIQHRLELEDEEGRV